MALPLSSVETRKDEEEDERVPASTPPLWLCRLISDLSLFFLLSVGRNAYTHAREDGRSGGIASAVVEI
jgi:hypothetical protein